MPFLDGRSHIFECAIGHKWESGDARHHSPIPMERYLCVSEVVVDEKGEPCPRRQCRRPIVKLTCPQGCLFVEIG